MTVIVQVPRVSYVGDGVETEFATTFTFEVGAELSVWRGQPTAADCCEAPDYGNLLHPDIDYVLQPGDWLNDGGVITVLDHALIADGEVITLMRTTPPDQPEAYGDRDEFSPEQAEATWDRIVRMVQELYHNPLGMLWLAGMAYTVRGFYPDTSVSEGVPVLDTILFERGVEAPAGWIGSRARVHVYPAEAKVITLKDLDGEEVGTLTIPTSGALVFAGAGGGFSAGGGVELWPPEGGLGETEGLSVTLALSVGA